MTGGGEKAVVFDLDGVLSRHDTMAALVLAACRGRPFTVALVFILFSATLMVPRSARPVLHRAIVRVALRRHTARSYSALVAATANHLVSRSDNLPVAGRKAYMQLSAASRVVVCTASETRMAEAYLAAAGLESTEVLGSRVDFASTGGKITQHNVGAEKVASLRRRTNARVTAVYTDSLSDLPLARIADAVVLVNRSRATAHRFFLRGVHVHRTRW